MPATARVVASVVSSMRMTIPTIWGYLEKVEELPASARNIQVRSILPDGIVLRVRAKIGPQTLIARGIKPIDVSGLLKGEFVELSYSHGREGSAGFCHDLRSTGAGRCWLGQSHRGFDVFKAVRV